MTSLLGKGMVRNLGKINEKQPLKLFDIHILDFDWLDVFEDAIQYDNVYFKLDSLTKYNGRCVLITNEWNVTIFDEKAEEKEVEFKLIENDDFRSILYTQYPLKG